MTDIKPKMVDGEPVCSGDCTCYQQIPYLDICECVHDNPIRFVREGISCIPGLRKQLNNDKVRIIELERDRDWALIKLCQEIAFVSYHTSRDRDNFDFNAEWKKNVEHNVNNNGWDPSVMKLYKSGVDN